jgi:hypothetical protein
VLHVHAKDGELVPHNARRSGCSRTAPGTAGPRLPLPHPGLGRRAVEALISELALAGYDGWLAIENEDPVFAPLDGLEKAVAAAGRVATGRDARLVVVRCVRPRPADARREHARGRACCKHPRPTPPPRAHSGRLRSTRRRCARSRCTGVRLAILVADGRGLGEVVRAGSRSHASAGAVRRPCAPGPRATTRSRMALERGAGSPPADGGAGRRRPGSRPPDGEPRSRARSSHGAPVVWRPSLVGRRADAA